MTQRILLIEDEDNLRKELSQILEKEIQGMAVDAYPAADEEALANLRREPESYLALITDWILPPPLQGPEIIREARRINPRLFIIAFTGKVQGHGSEALQKGADLYLYKPVDPAELVGVIKNLSEQDGAFYSIAQTAQSLMKSAQVLVWRYHEKRKELTLAAWSDPSSITKDDQATILPLFLPGNESLPNKPLQNVLDEKDEPVFIRSLQHPACYHSPKFANRHTWQTLVSVPLHYQGELIGLLESYTLQSINWEALKQQNVPKMLWAYVNKSAEAIYHAGYERKGRELINMSSLLTENHSLENVANAILAKGLQLLNVDAGWMYVRDFEKNELRLVQGPDKPKGQVPKWLKMGELIAGQSVQEGIVQRIDDTEIFSAVEPLPAASIRSQVAAPLRRAELTIGVIVFGSRQPHAFSEGDISLIRSFATLASQALDQAKLRLHLQKISKSVWASTKELGESIVVAAQDLTGKAATLWLLDEAKSQLTVQAARGVSQKFIRAARIRYTGQVDSLISQAFSRKETVSYPNMEDEAAPKNIQLLELARQEGWKSTLAVPFFDSESKPVGALALHGKRVGEFSSSEIISLESFASQASAAIENTQRRGSLVQLVKSGQVTVRHVTDERRVLEEFVELACKLSGAPCAVIYPYDPERGAFFAADKIAAYGLEGRKKKIGDKQRDQGLATIIRQVGQIVVHNLESGEMESFAIPSEEKMDQGDLLEMIRRGQFIQRERIQAFLGISLRASDVTPTEKQDEEMGVLYINYRAPHHFTPSEIDLIRLFALQAANLIRTARLVARQHEQTNINQMLVDASQELAQASSRNNVVTTVLNQAFKFIGEATGMVMSVETDHTLNVIDWYGLDEMEAEDFNRQKHSAHRGSFGIVVSTGEIFESLDTRADLAAGRIEDMGLPIPKQVTNLPLKYAGKVNAILVLDTVAPNPRIRKALLALADMASTALEKVLAYEERSQQLDTLQKIIDALGAGEKPLRVILEQAVQLFGADYGNISLSIEAARELILDTHWEESRLLTAEEIPADKRRISYDQGIAGYVAREKKAYRTGNVGDDPYYLPWYESTQSEMTVPLIDSREILIGILDLESNLPDAFSEADQALFERLARIAAVAIEKSEMLRVTQLLQNEIENLQEVHIAASLEEALRYVVQGVVDILGAKTCSCSINLFDEEEGHFLPTMVAAGSMWEELVRVPPRPDGLGMHVIRTRQAVYFEDVTQPQKGVPRVNNNLLNLGVESFAALPLLRGQRRLGALFIHQKIHSTFSVDLRRMLELYARQAALVIDEAQSYRLGEALRRIQDASVSQPLSGFLALVVDEAAKIMQAEYGSLWLKQPDGSLRQKAFHEPEHVAVSKLQLVIPPDTPSINIWVLEHRQARIVRQVENAKDEFLRIYPDSQSSITVPLLYQGEAIGTLNLESQRAKAFTEQDIPRLMRFANPAAIAIHNADLVQRERDQKQQADTLREVAQVLNAVSDQAKVIKLVLEHLHSVIDYTHASVQLFRGDRRIAVEDVPASTIDLAAAERLHRDISEDPLVQEIVLSRGPKVVSDVSKEPLWEVLEATKSIRSWMGIPLVANDQIIGLLTIDHEKAGIYTEETGQLAAAFASIVAAAIQRSQQDQALIEINQLSQELLKRIGPDTGIEKLLQQIADKALEVLRADIIQLFDYRQSSKDFGFLPFSAGKLLVSFRPSKMPNPDDVIYRLLQLSEPSYIHNTLDAEYLQESFTKERGELPTERFVVREKIKSNAIVPLRSGEELVGLLFVNYRASQAFDPGQKTIIELFASQAALAIQNARLFQEQQRRNIELELISRAGQAVTSSIDYQQVLKTVLDKVCEMMNVTAASIWLVDVSTQELECQQVTGQASEKTRKVRLKKGEGIAGWVVQHGESCIVLDAAQDLRHTEAVDRLTGLDIHSIASIPLQSKDQMIGVLQVVDTQVGRFNQGHLKLLEPLAAFAAAAIENARLFEERSRAAQRMDFVNQMSLDLTRNLDISELEALELIRDTARRLMDDDIGNMFIALYDQDTDIVSFGLAYVDGERIDTATEPGWKPRRGGNGMTEEVIHQKKPILIKTRAEGKDWYLTRTNSIQTTFASWLGVPMLVEEQSKNNPKKVEERVIGVIATYHKTEENKYDQNNREVLELISRQAAIALHNVHQVKEINQRNEEIKRQNEELNQRNEEIKRQNEELNRRNEELTQLTELGVTLGNISGLGTGN